MNIAEQVRIIEAQINSEHAKFTLVEKLAYIHGFFKPDPMFSQDAIDIVIGNISKTFK